jgi:transcriptional regulator with XRE-family HTH domain
VFYYGHWAGRRDYATPRTVGISPGSSGEALAKPLRRAEPQHARVDDRKVGLIIRALRRRRGWRQVDLSSRAGVPQSVVSEIERGHIARTEATYSEYGERGSFDVLAWRPDTGHLVVVEVKTELLSAEATLRKMDEKVRLAPKIVRERYGWRPRAVSRVLVLSETTVNRRRSRAHAGLFRAALPASPAQVRRWLREPNAPIDGTWFLPLIAPSGGKQKAPARHRLRCPSRPA